jgi:hypothetical protein
MKILIGIIGNDAARFHEFTASTLRLRRPENTDLEMLIGGDWCGARNALAQATLDGGYSHLWFMDDDHSFSPDLLLRLAAWDKALVTPICLQRVFPFAPVEYVKAPPRLAHHGDFVPLDLSDYPGGGLIEIESGGAAGMLIRRDVLEAVSQPWFEYGDVSEDIRFCEKAKEEAGVTIYADLGARLGHITTCVVIPSYTEEHGWTTGLRVGKDYDIRVKQTYDLIEDGRREPAAASAIVRVEPGEGEVGPVEPPLQVPATQPPVGGSVGVEPTPGAERIEIWMDDELHWWWRAIDHEGIIIAQDSAIREDAAIAAALSFYPGTPVNLIQRELDNSLNPQQYGPPVRLWDRGVR